MTPETPTYTPAEKDALQGLQGQELARQQIEIANQQANTVRDIRTNIHNILQDTEQTADAEAIAVLQEHEDAVEDMTDGYDAVQIEDFSGGKLGDNIVGTHNSRIDRDLFSYDAVKEHADQTEEVLLHEDGDAAGTVGHADQTVDLQALAVDAPDAVLEGAELLEGENEAGLSKKLRSSVHTSRAGQPKELYGSGQKKVAPHYDAIRDYVRNGADRVNTQAAIFRTAGTSKERMQELMQHAGYTAPEMQQVLQQAA